MEIEHIRPFHALNVWSAERCEGQLHGNWRFNMQHSAVQGENGVNLLLSFSSSFFEENATATLSNHTRSLT